MFPIKTDTFTFKTGLTEMQVENILVKKIFQVKLFQMTTDDTFYGSIKSNKSKFALGQSPSRNSFRPMVNLTWKATDKGTEIYGYFSMDRRITAAFTILPILGIYTSVLNKIFIPFVVVTLLYLFLMFVVLRPLYNYSKRNTKIKLDELMKELQSIK